LKTKSENQLPKSNTSQKLPNSSSNQFSLGMSKSSSSASNQYQLNSTKNCLSSNLNLADYLNPLLGYTESSLAPSKSSCAHVINSSFQLNPNLEAYFTNTIGSSYYSGSGAYTIVLTSAETKELCQIIKKLFVKNMIVQLNRYLNEFLAHQQVK
jgi:hypothetical protein